MKSWEQTHAFWSEIIRRIEAGEAQTAIAAANGMSIGQFRYRLRKYMELLEAIPLEGIAQTAATSMDKEMSDGFTEGVTDVALFEREVLLPQVGRALLDDAWTDRRLPNRIVLMVKDPTSLFVYWDVQPSRKRLLAEHFETDWEHLPLFLQVYDVTDLYFDGYHAQASWRVPISSAADNWYLHGVQPNRRYLVDLGTVTLHGQLFTILRSNIVATPNAPLNSRQEPTVKFASLDREAAHSVRAKIAVQGESLPMLESWHEQFDGYSLAEKRGVKR
jgi:hypothetical protein